MPLYLQFSPLATSAVVHVLRCVIEIFFIVTLGALSIQFHKASAAADTFIQVSILGIFSEL